MKEHRKYTAEEATQLYLDELKATDPGPAVQKVILEIEDELKKKRARPKKRQGPSRMQPIPH